MANSKISKMHKRVQTVSAGGTVDELGKTWENLTAKASAAANEVNNIYSDITRSIESIIQTCKPILTNDYVTRIGNILDTVVADTKTLNDEMTEVLKGHEGKTGLVTGPTENELYFKAMLGYSRCVENMQAIIMPITTAVTDISFELQDKLRAKIAEETNGITPEQDAAVITDVTFTE